jgi:hypothetical protein
VRVRREVILGAKREMTKHLAERQMEIVLSRINGFDYRPVRVATFGEFIERWKTEVLTKQQPSSARAVTSHLKCYIVPQLSKLRLEQFGVENQQTFTTRVFQKGVSRKTLLNVLGTLSSILSTARDWGYTCEDRREQTASAATKCAIRGVSGTCGRNAARNGVVTGNLLSRSSAGPGSTRGG